MPGSSQFDTDRTHPGRWTITFSNPPINMFVPTTIVELGALMTDLAADPSAKVVVFQSWVGYRSIWIGVTLQPHNSWCRDARNNAIHALDGQLERKCLRNDVWSRVRIDREGILTCRNTHNIIQPLPRRLPCWAGMTLTD
jgi:hypothetical protein